MIRTRVTMRSGSSVGGVLAAAVLLVACGSSSDTAGSATAGPSASAAAAVSSAIVATSTEPSTPASVTASGPAVGGSLAPTGTVEVDAQTYAWFDTFCTGVASFGALGDSSPSSPEELGELLTTVGTTFTDTGAQLAALPPPTFDGGAEVAQQLVTNMQQGGPVFTEYGQQAAALDPNDQAAGQQFQADFQAAVAALGISSFTPPPAARAAVTAVPSCEVLGS